MISGDQGRASWAEACFRGKYGVSVKLFYQYDDYVFLRILFPGGYTRHL